MRTEVNEKVILSRKMRVDFASAQNFLKRGRSSDWQRTDMVR